MTSHPWLNHYDPGVPPHLDYPAVPVFARQRVDTLIHLTTCISATHLIPGKKNVRNHEKHHPKFSVVCTG